MTSSAPVPQGPPTVEVCAEQLRRASNYLAELEERESFLVRSAASLHDEIKVARRTKTQAEKNLLVAANKPPRLLPVDGSNKAVQTVKVS